ncbi:MAG: Cupin 2, conserved barrel domain protein [Marmoricola sp.]|nr:Cupin 2, conserved barrel domain protein [Marmoricola sp.]
MRVQRHLRALSRTVRLWAADYPRAMVSAKVRQWHEDLGWGVLDSLETDGGCWVHFSVIESPVLSSIDGVTVSEYKPLEVGETVELEFEAVGQDGYDYRATTVRRAVK